MLAVGAMVVILGACDPNPYVGRPDGPRVAVVGDSLTSWVTDRQNGALVGDGWSASVTGIPGFTIRDQFDMLEKVAASRPQVVVVALGTNDLRQIDAGTQTWGGLRADARRALSIVRNVPCVVWVGVTEQSGAYANGHRHDTAGWAVNWWLHTELRAARPDPRQGVWVDWASASRGRQELFSAVDDVHHSEAGRDAYSRLLHEGVRACPGNPILGNVDVAIGGAGTVRVAGWAADPDAPSIDAHVYADGRWAGSVRADGPRPDVRAVHPRFSGANGFDRTFTVAPGTREVCVFAINVGPPAPNPRVACRPVRVS